MSQPPGKNEQHERQRPLLDRIASRYEQLEERLNQLESQLAATPFGKESLPEARATAAQTSGENPLEPGAERVEDLGPAASPVEPQRRPRRPRKPR